MSMNFTLNTNGGVVRYIVKQQKQVVGSSTKAGTAIWMIGQGSPYKSDEFPGYPIAVKEPHGDEYFFAGRWNEDGGEEPDPEVEPKTEPKPGSRKRRMKDIVCE